MVYKDTLPAPHGGGFGGIMSRQLVENDSHHSCPPEKVHHQTRHFLLASCNR